MYLGKRLCTRLCILYIYTYIHFYINLSIYIYIAFYVCVLGSVSVFELSKGQSVAYICKKILSKIQNQYNCFIFEGIKYSYHFRTRLKSILMLGLSLQGIKTYYNIISDRKCSFGISIFYLLDHDCPFMCIFILPTKLG